jgi:hypothetical protein
VYALVVWLEALGAAPHRTALAALAHLVAALLAGQDLRAAGLMRALVSPPAVPARQRYKRVARAWDRPWLAPGWLTPRLVRAALALVAPDPVPWPTAGLTHLVLDGVRCGPWEVFTVGVAWHGRVLPVGWAVLPYPWPKRAFTPTACALVQRVAAAWPADRPAHLVADRAFPSRPLLRALAEAGWGFTLRLRAKHWVTVGEGASEVRSLLGAADRDRWAAAPARYGTRAADPTGTLVLGRGLAVLPAWQANPGSAAARARRGAARRSQLRRKHPGRRPDASPSTDAWAALFTTHPTWRAAVASYKRRWTTEGSYRDAQGGWDGRHGWGLDRAVARLTAAAEVERVLGLWALGALAQSWLGHQASQPGQPPALAAALGRWTTTGRLSVWARGQLALATPELRPWVAATLRLGAERLASPVDAAAPHPWALAA